MGSQVRWSENAHLLRESAQSLSLANAVLGARIDLCMRFPQKNLAKNVLRDSRPLHEEAGGGKRGIE